MFKVIKSLTRSYGYSLQWIGPDCPSYIVGPQNSCYWYRYKRDATKRLDVVNAVETPPEANPSAVTSSTRRVHA